MCWIERLFIAGLFAMLSMALHTMYQEKGFEGVLFVFQALSVSALLFGPLFLFGYLKFQKFTEENENKIKADS